MADSSCEEGGIVHVIMEYVKDNLQRVLIDEIAAIDPNDVTLVGQVTAGKYDGTLFSEERILVSIVENDDDDFGERGPQGMYNVWTDEMDDDAHEIGAITWIRRFTIKVRGIFEEDKEGSEEARRIINIVRARVETLVWSLGFPTITCGTEYVSSPTTACFSEEIQKGGPDSVDYFCKIRFEVKTTKPRQIGEY